MFWRKYKTALLIPAVFLVVVLFSGCSLNNNQEEIDQARKSGYRTGSADGFTEAVDVVIAKPDDYLDIDEICSESYQAGYDEAVADVKKYGLKKVEKDNAPMTDEEFKRAFGSGTPEEELFKEWEQK